MFSGTLPEWPFTWPMAGNDKLTARVRPEFVEFLKKAIQLDPTKRFTNAIQMYAAFEKLHTRARRQRQRGTKKKVKIATSWRQIRWREFQRQYKKQLDTRHQCRRCEGPVAESMQACPWCGFDNPTRGSQTTMPADCPPLTMIRTWGGAPFSSGNLLQTTSALPFPARRLHSKYPPEASVKATAPATVNATTLMVASNQNP